MEATELLPLDARCTLPASQVAEDYAAARRIGAHRVGQAALYLDRGFETNPIRYVPFADIERIEKRIFPIKTKG